MVIEFANIFFVKQDSRVVWYFTIYLWAGVINLQKKNRKAVSVLYDFGRLIFEEFEEIETPVSNYYTEKIFPSDNKYKPLFF